MEQPELATTPQQAQPSLPAVAQPPGLVKGRSAGAGGGVRATLEVRVGVLVDVHARARVHPSVLLGRADQGKKKLLLLRAHQSKPHTLDVPLLQGSGTPSATGHGIFFLWFMCLAFAGIIADHEGCSWPLLLSLPGQIMNPQAGYFLLTPGHSLNSLLDVELRFA